jgi:hypothetical protein
MHDAGIKVYLDVVYNHTGEGSRQLSFRGLDNATYDELTNDNQRNCQAPPRGRCARYAFSIARPAVDRRP